MTKKSGMFAAALLSVALWTGCATGGGGHTGAQITVTVDSDPIKLVQSVGVTLTQQFKATVDNTENKAVTWSLTYKGASCAAAVCGTISSNGLYTAPAVPPAAKKPDNEVEITATSVANPTKSDTFPLPVVGIVVVVTPGPAMVGTDLQQQFIATASPDAEPQTMQWSIGGCPTDDCGTVDAGTGLYTAPSIVPAESSFTIQAGSTVDPNLWFGSSTVTVADSRLPAGTYAFQFSGTNIAGPIASIGTFVSDGNGHITGGALDELNDLTPMHRLISSGSYTLDSNNHGTLTLKPAGVSADSYLMAIDAAGDIKVVETTADGSNRHTSGVIELALSTKFKDKTKLSGSFVFSFNGTDGTGNRVGYVGVLPMDGSGGITGGLIDINAPGRGTTGNGTAVTGTYDINNGFGFLTFTAGGLTYHFNLYGVNGTTNANNPLTLYAISTDSVLANPAVVGTLVYQDKSVPFDTAGFSATSLASLTGVDPATGTDTFVSLSSVFGDGTGKSDVFYDANNAGTLVSVPSDKSASYTYAATSGGTGRYTLDLLGDPNVTPVVPPTHFILYCDALVKNGKVNAPRGFLLEQFDAANTKPSVMTGTMDPQILDAEGIGAAQLAGPFAAATTVSGSSGVLPIAANLVLTSPGKAKFLVAGNVDVSGQTSGEAVTGTYNVEGLGDGPLQLTLPDTTVQNYIIYALDHTHFMMIRAEPKTDPGHASIISAQQ